MTSPNAAPPNPGTRTRPNPPSKTCSPSYAEPLSQHELPALPHPSPIHTNTATTNWPAPQPPHNCETQVLDSDLLLSVVVDRRHGAWRAEDLKDDVLWVERDDLTRKAARGCRVVIGTQDAV